MVKLSEYAEIVEYYSQEPIQIYLPDVEDLDAVEGKVLDYSDDDTAEYCEVIMMDGERYFFKCSLSFALDLYRNIMRFKLARLMDVRTNKVFVY